MLKPAKLDIDFKGNKTYLRDGRETVKITNFQNIVLKDIPAFQMSVGQAVCEMMKPIAEELGYKIDAFRYLNTFENKANKPAYASGCAEN